MKKFYLLSVFFILAAYRLVNSQGAYYYTGVIQTYTVPLCGVDSISVRAWGGGGGGAGADSHDYNLGGAGGNGGGGAYASATVAVNGGDVLHIYVGGGGGGGEGCVTGYGAGAGGFGYGSGGKGGDPGIRGCSGGGGGGGGASAIYDVTTGTLLFAAAGGGGGGGGGGEEYGYGQQGGGGGVNGRADSSADAYGGLSGSNVGENGTMGDTATWFNGSYGQDGGGGGGGGGGANGGLGGGAPDCDCGAAGGGGGSSLATVVLNGYYSMPGNGSDTALCSNCATGGAGDANWSYSTAAPGGNGKLIFSVIGAGGNGFTPGVNPGDTLICAGNSVALQATGGTAYSWGPSTDLSGTSISNPVASPANSITYYVTVTNGVCTGVDSVVITVTPNVPGNPGIIKVPANATCLSGPVLLTDSGSTGPIQWQSSTDGFNFINIPGAIGLTYFTEDTTQLVYYRVISSGSCSGNSQTNVVLAGGNGFTPGVNPGDTLICAGNSVALQATGGTAYSWGPSTDLTGTSISNPVASPANSITYYVTVTNGVCTGVDSVVITVTPNVPGNPGIIKVPANATCLSGPVLLTDSGSTGPIQWQSSTDGFNFINIPGATGLTYLTEDTTQLVYYRVISSGSCSGNSQTNVVLAGGNGFTPGVNPGDTLICAGNSVALQATGGTAYSWGPSTDLTGTSTSNPVASPTNSITYYVTVTNGVCTGVDSVVITVTPNVPGNPGIIKVPANATCLSGPVLLTDSGSTGPIQWQSSTDGFNFINIPGATGLTYLTEDTAQLVYYRVIGGGGCTGSRYTNVAVAGGDSIPVVQITTDKNIFCAGDSAELCATPGFATYTWNIGYSTRCFETTLPGTYDVTVTDNRGCTASSNNLTLSIYPQSPVVITISGDTLQVYYGASYQWYFNGALLSGDTATVLIATISGFYSVVETDANGCIATSTQQHITLTGIEPTDANIFINVYPNPAKANWHLEVSSELLGSSVEVFDATGRLVFKSIIKYLQSSVDIPGIVSGVYELHVTCNGFGAVRKLIKM